MLLYVFDIKREAELFAYGTEGDECTEELLLSLCDAENFYRADGNSALRSEERSPLACFYRLNEESREDCDTSADYGISRAMYNEACDFINNSWQECLDSVSKIPRGKRTEDMIAEYVPRSMVKYLV